LPEKIPVRLWSPKKSAAAGTPEEKLPEKTESAGQPSPDHTKAK